MQASSNSTGGFYTKFFPGTGEDLFLSGAVNVRTAFLAGQRAQVAQAGDVFYPAVRSLEGQFAGAPAFLVGEVFTSSPIVPIDAPGLQFSAGGHFLLVIGTIGPAGLLGSLPIPAGASGLNLLMQGLAISPWAGNAIFGSTDAATLTLL